MSPTASAWTARITVAIVFALNLQCAMAFIVSPDTYAGAYELSGEVGSAMVRGLGVAFLMWNVTYPLVILEPREHKTLFAVVLVQQLVGLVGESFILLSLEGHPLLASSITRFIIFDGAGLLLMGIAFILVLHSEGGCETSRRG